MATNDEGNVPAIDAVSNIQIFLYCTMNAYTHFTNARRVTDMATISTLRNFLFRWALKTTVPGFCPLLLFYGCCKLTIT